MNRLSPSSSPGIFKVLTVAILSFAMLTMPLASAAAASFRGAVSTSSASTDAKKTATSSNDLSEKQLFVDPPAARPAAESFVQPVAPPPPPGQFSATLVGVITATANNVDLKADPGDTITYTATLDNQTGTDATALSFTVPIDSHVNLGTLNSTPVAFDLSQTPFNEDAAPVTITLAGQDPDGSNLTFSKVTDPTKGSLGAISAATCGASGCTATVSYTPTANANGSDSFTYRVNDGTANSNQTATVSITINAVNDAPTFTTPAGNPAAVNEDSGAQTVSNYISGIRPAQVGNSDEDSQTVSFEIVSNSNTGLFTAAGVQLNVNAGAYPKTANLTYTPLANQNGTAIITYRLKDSGCPGSPGIPCPNGGVDISPDQTFTITVNAVNDAPVVVSPTSVTPFAIQANMKRTGLGGLLASVTDADSGVNGCTPTPFTVKAGSISATSPAGGTISNVNLSAGTFDFDPPPGVTGNVTFTYVVSDNGCPGVADSAPVTVTMNVSGPVIWFVNPPSAAPAAGGDGRLSNPFNRMVEATNAMGTNASQRIFVYKTLFATIAGQNVSLQGNTTQATAQWLIGQGAVAASFDALMGITVPANTIARPSLGATAAAADALRPTIQGQVTMKENTRVEGLNINVTGAPGAPKGLTGSNWAINGAITIKDVNVTSATGNAVDFTNASLNGQTLSYTSSDTTNSPNILVSVGGIALNVSNATIGTGFTFRSISANGGTKGISLNNTGANGLTVEGTGTTDGSGGVIQNCTTRGAELLTVGPTTLKNMNFINNGGIAGTGSDDAACDGSDGNDNGNCHAGIHVNTMSNLVLNNLDVTDGNQQGINLISVTGLTMTNLNVLRNGDEVRESGVQANNIGGTVSITGNTFKDNNGRQFDMSNFGAQNPVITFSGNTVSNTTFPAVTGEQGAFFANGVGATGTLTATITGNTFDRIFSYAVRFDAAGGSMVPKIGQPGAGNGNTFTNNGLALLISGGNSGSVNFEVKNNTATADETVTNNTHTIPFSFTRAPGATGNWTGTIDSNTIGATTNNAADKYSGCYISGCSGIEVTDNGADVAHILHFNITNNQIRHVTGNGISFSAVGIIGKGNVTAVITGNTIQYPENFAGAAGDASASGNGILVLNGDDVNDEYKMCLEISSNTVDGHWADAAATGPINHDSIRLRQRTENANGTFRIRNWDTTIDYDGAGGPGQAGDALRFIENNNTITNFIDKTGFQQSITAPNFTGGTAACPLLLAEGGVLAALNGPTAVSSLLLSALSTSEYEQNDPDSLASEPSAVSSSLSQPQLDAVVSSAIERWSATGLNQEQIATLRGIKFEVADMGGLYLGEADQNHVLIDRNAGGKGWYIDADPMDDSDFGSVISATRRYTDPASAAAGHLDLLTAIMHEMGHNLRLNDSYEQIDRNDLMYGYLTVGERRLPINGQAVNAIASLDSRPHHLLLSPSVENLAAEIRAAVDSVSNQPADSFASAVASATMLMPFPAGSFPINGTGSGFTLPNNRTTTITFTVTVKNPPNFAGVPPATPQISHQGTLQGSIGTILTDNPATGAANDATVTLVDLFNTTTTITGASPSNSTNTGQAVTFTASIVENNTPDPAGGTLPGGTATFKDNGTDITGCVNVTVTSGSAQCTTSALTTGPHNNITVAYNGDGNFDPSTSAAFTQTVSQSGTSTAVTSSLNPSLVTQNVTFTAEVTSSGAITPPTGTVQFHEGVTNFGAPVALTSGGACPAGKGCASFSISSLTAGGHTIAGDYNPDAAFTASSGSVLQTVNKSGTTTTLGSSLNPSTPTQTVTYTATVTSQTAVTGPFTGSVTFEDNGAPIVCEAGSQALTAGGVATCKFTYPDTVGSPHPIKAIYSGDGTFIDSTSNTVNQDVSQTATTTALVSSSNPSAPGVNITFTATVNTASGTPTGTVTFKKDGVALVCDNGATATQPLTGNTATCDTDDLVEAGSPHDITAEYNGDSVFSGSISNTVSQDITSCSASVVVTSAADDNSVGTLRKAISTGVCADGTITFDTAGVFATPKIIELTDANGELVVSKNMTIIGPGAQRLTVRRSTAATTDFRVFRTITGTTVAISDMTISNGKATGASHPDNAGAGIYNQGNLTLFRVAVSGNTSNSHGGGIYHEIGSLYVIDSTFSGNSATLASAVGGAIIGNADMTVVNSTISGNSAPSGGGLMINTGTLTIKNSTVVNNQATGGNGGGIRGDGGTTTILRNTIVANNTATTNGPDVGGNGVFDTTNGFNLIENPDLITIAANNITAQDPNLGPLALNGGPTQTHALLDNSPAIDNGNNPALTTLNGAINAGTFTVTVTDANAIPAGSTIRIETEQMFVVSRAANVLTVTRGANGTTAAAHADTTSVYPAFDQRGFPRTVNFDTVNPPPGDDTDIGAYERQLTPLAPGAPDLDAASDTGTSSTDDLTSDTSPTFTIMGVTPGATVELLRDISPGTGTLQVETATVVGTITPGTKQVETITVLGGPVTVTGSLLVKVTAANINGGTTKNINVPVAAGETASVVAGNIKAAFDLDSEIPTFFDVTASGADVELKAKVAAADDTSLLVEIIGCGNSCTGISDSDSVDTTAGVAPNAGTKQVETLTVSGGPISGCAGSSSISLTVTANGMNNSGVPLAVAVSDGDTATQVADKIFAFLGTPAGADVTNFFDVTRVNAADVVFTAKTAAGDDVTMKATIANDTCGGLTAPFESANTIPGVAPIAGIKQEETVTVTGAPTTAAGDILVRVTAAGVNGGAPKNFTVSLASGDSGSQVAIKIKAVLDLDAEVTALYDVTTSGATVILTRDVAAANDPSLLVSIVGCVNPPCTGLSPSNSVDTTPGDATGGSGNATITVTADEMNNSPKTLNVPVVAGDTAAQVAGKMITALSADPDVSAFFTVSAGPNPEDIVLTAITAAADDSSINIAIDNGTATGLTPDAVSDDTTPGAAGPIVRATGVAVGTSIQLTDPSVPPSATPYLYTARQTVNGQPRSPQSVALSVTIDNSSPSAPDAPDLLATSDTGSDQTDELTNDTTPTFEIGNVTNGFTVDLIRDCSPVTCSPTVVASGTATGATIQLTDPSAPQGSYSYTSRQTNGLGNSTSSTSALIVNVDTTPPPPPTTPDLQTASDGGNSDNITNAASLSFDVGTAAGVTVQLLRDGTVVDSDNGTGGTVVLTDSPSPTDNDYDYTAIQIDSAGNISAPSAALNVTIDKTGTAAGIPDLKSGDDSFGPSGTNLDDITNDTSRSFDIPSTETGSLVELYRDATFIASTTGNGGIVTLVDNSALADGPYDYISRQTDIAGNVADSAALTVTFDSTSNPPGTPDLKNTSDTGTSDSDDRTGNASHAFDIPSQTGAFVELLRNGVVVDSTTALGLSTTLNDATSLADGLYHYSARQTDKAGNVASSADLDVTIDTTGPSVSTVTRVNASPTNATSVDFLVTFNEPVQVSGVDASDFSVTTSGGIDLTGTAPFVVTPVAPVGSPSVASQYTVTVQTGTGDGTIRLDVVANNTILDVMNIPLIGGFNTGQVYTISKSDPFVSSITRVESNPTNLGTVNYTVTFSKPVSGVNIGAGSDFALTKTGAITGESITGLSGSGAVYTVTVNTGSNDGTLRLDVIDNDSIVDSGARPLGGVGLVNGDFTTGQVFTIDKTKPTITVVKEASQPDPTTGPTSTTVINFTVTFGEAVTGFDSSDVSLVGGTAGATVANVTGSGTTYNVGVEGMTTTGSVKITVPADAGFDSAGNGNLITPSNTATVNYIRDDFATFVVNSKLDGDNGLCEPIGTNNGCTLREAINAANADAGAETITFDPSVFTIPGPHVINLTGVLPDISSSMTIDGPGANVLTVKRNTGGDYRIFNISLGNYNVTFNGLTISNGNAVGGTGLGGGIFNVSAGTVNISACTISGNSSAFGGGGIFSNGVGTVNITNSTISGNSSFQGGGMELTFAGAMNITNSTISGNSATNNGGGILTSDNSLTITNSTITDNRADNDNNGVGTGGGIYRNTGTVILRSTIVARNYNDASPSTTADDISGTMDASSSFNLIGTGGSGGLLDFSVDPTPAHQNKVGVPDPGLDVLANNGGPTLTHALLCTSPAIDKGKAFGQTTDQRGFTRAFDFADSVYPNAAGGDGTDIGALETQSGSGCLPLAFPPASPTTTAEDTPVTIQLKGTYSQNTALTFTITDQPDHGTLGAISAPVCTGTTPQNCTADVQYTPAANYNGPDVFKFKVTAGGLESDEADVPITITPVNDPPVANNQTPNTDEEVPIPIILSASDGDGDTLTWTVLTNPTGGVLSGTAPNLTYTPNPNFFGPDSFTFRVNDGTVNSNTATVSITVNPVNDGPINTVPATQNTPENFTLVFSSGVGNRISIADVDAGNNAVQVSLTATNGTMTLNGTVGLVFSPFNANNNGVDDATLNFTGSITNINNALNGMIFTPTPGYSGPASIQIVTNDQGRTGSGGALSDTDTVDINVLEGGTLALSSSTYTVDEAAGTATITVNRTGGSSGITTVNYTTSNGTAVAGVTEDYTTASGTLTFADGVTTRTFTIPINNDALDEADETVNIAISSVTGSGVLGAPATAVLTITDNDPPPSISINDVSQFEGNSGTTSFTFTVSLSAPAGQPVTVNYATADGTAIAPSDYTAIPTTLLTFNPLETSKTVTVLVNGDTNAEIDETFFVNLSTAVNATIADNQGVGLIISEDTPVVQFTSPTYSVNEGGSHATITVTRVGDLTQPLNINYATTDPSGLNECSQLTSFASQRCDYATVVGTLRFAALESSKEIIIPIVDDVYIEGDETFTITLSQVVGGELGNPISATITIVDNDSVPAPNPIFNDAFFVRQLYIDLLGRLPEPGAVNSWLGILNNCAIPSDPVNGCDRIAVAAGFLRSQEFQVRGFFVYRHYSAVLGRIPLYSEYIPDMAKVNGFLSNTDLEANKLAYTDEVMNRPEFHALYDSTLNNPTAYVDKLLQTANLPNHPGRAGWIAALTNNTLTRAQVLREFIDSTDVYTKYVNEAFIIMNYFGFLRRSADGAYQAWFTIFNNSNDYRLIINGFMNSAEYRLRFGPTF